MSQQLIDRSADLRRLREDGYDIVVRSGHLLLTVPYVDANRKVREGRLVSELSLAGDVTTAPGTHVAMFIGGQPCQADGTEIPQIKNSVGDRDLGGGLVINRQFSAKPRSGSYRDYHDKMTTYANIIAGPAHLIDPAAQARTFRVRDSEESVPSVFVYADSASVRVGIGAATDRLKGQKIAIVGLGGTGGYVLDLVSKCPATEIHLFDGDVFVQHNAFRAPGAAHVRAVRGTIKKVDYFARLYRRMHLHVIAHPVWIDAANADELAGFDFVFVCVDEGISRKVIVEALERHIVRFVDVGMGLHLTPEHQLVGMLRVTTSTPEAREHLRKRASLSDGDVEDEYRTNIQVADLNCLNAALAVIKWKKLCGFYQDVEQEHHSTYSVNVNLLTGIDKPCESAS